MTNQSSILLITGGAKRLGKAISLSLAKAGWQIGLHYNKSEIEVIKLETELKAIGANIVTLQADLSNANEATNLVNSCCEKLGAPSLLINNASLFENDQLESFNSDEFDTHFKVNLRAPLLLAQAFAKSLGKENSGNIINITDQRVHNLKPTFFTYTLSKVGLAAATVTMAQALAPNIRVNAIAPGPVLQSIHQSQEDFETESASTPLGHGTTTDEIVNAIQFILNSPSLTGETITLDGGQHLTWK